MRFPTIFGWVILIIEPSSGLLSACGRFFSEVPSTIHHWTFGCAQGVPQGALRGFHRPQNFASTNGWKGFLICGYFPHCFPNQGLECLVFIPNIFGQTHNLVPFAETTWGLQGFQTWQSAGLLTKGVVIECKRSSQTNVPETRDAWIHFRAIPPVSVSYLCHIWLGEAILGIQTNRIILFLVVLRYLFFDRTHQVVGKDTIYTRLTYR